MLDLLKLLGGFAVGLFRLQAAREAEMAFLRQQLLVLKRSAPARLRLRIADRLIFVWLYRLFPSLLGAAVIFQPQTLVRWHRSGFRLYWRWKSGRRAGRPAIPAEIRNLVRAVSRDNPLWGAPRIHGELMKLGVDIAQSTVAKYMPRRHRPPSPGWRAFLRSHTAHIAAIDLFVVPAPRLCAAADRGHCHVNFRQAASSPRRFCCARHAAFRTHVSCCQTLNASVRSARYAEAASRCRRGWK